MINTNELKYSKNNELYSDGYRIVYFYEDGTYSIGEYCQTIEDFMIGLNDEDPVLFEDDIPKFISTEDFLSKCMKYNKKAVSASIYRTNGELVESLRRK